MDEDTGELFELDTEGIDMQTEELGTFLYDEVEVKLCRNCLRKETAQLFQLFALHRRCSLSGV